MKVDVFEGQWSGIGVVVWCGGFYGAVRGTRDYLSEVPESGCKWT
jgi:hypothetical protein